MLSNFLTPTMTESYTIKRRENPFQFFASEFLGDIPNADELLTLDAEVGALVYVINTGYTYIQAQKGDWKQLKAGKGSTGRPGERGPEGPMGPAGKGGTQGSEGRPGRDGRSGAKGERGLTGKDGKDGVNGRDGLPGLPGQNGKNGADGRDGKDGQHGKDGSRGLTGTNGEDGRGWIGGKYDHVTGQVTFTSDDGLTFKTGDLRGSPAPWANLTLEQLANALKPYL